MAQLQHTPGPWSVEKKDGKTTVTAPDHEEPDATPWEIAKVEICASYGEDPIEANARLIAAAPDLLEALQLVMARMGWYTIIQNMSQADYDKVKAAIDKATNP